MFKTLILKEIHESIQNFRFWLVSALCLLLIPFGLYIASKDYQSRLIEYQNEQRVFIEQNQGKINGGSHIQGFFPPSQLSILSSGLKDYLPYKTITSKDGFGIIEKKQQDSNLQSVLFGKIDFLFIVTNFLSLLALIFTFGSISSEKEQGTLKLVLSNQVPRWKVIIAKIFGNYLVFLAPFITSVIFGLIITQWVTDVNFLSDKYLKTLIIILFFTMLFLLMFFNLGIWASVISRNTISSIVILLFVWVIISLCIPRISPMIAQIIFPVKTEDVFRKEYQTLKRQIEDERNAKRQKLLEKLVEDNNINVDFGKGFPNLREIGEKQTNYPQLVEAIDKEYDQRINKELGIIENDYRQKQEHQMNIASNLSRISPISSYSFLSTELCNTGLMELNNCKNSAQKFQYQINSEIYNNYIDFQYFFKGSSAFSTEPKKGFDPKNIQVPVMTQYEPVPLNAIFQKIWPDIVLLIWYSIFFFTGAFVSFLRFDAR